jgi:uncharacterized protein (TIGR02594 family)
MARTKGSGGGRRGGNGKPPEKPPGKEKLGDRLTRYAMYGQMYNDRGSNMTMGQRAGGAVFNALEQGTLGRMGMLGGAISAGIHSKKPGGATEGGSGVDTQTIPFQQIKGDDIVSAINQSTRQVVTGLNAVNTTMGRGLNSLRDGIQAQSQALNSIVGANEDVAIQMREMMEALNKMGYDRGGSEKNNFTNAGFIGSQPSDASRQNNDSLLQDMVQGAIISSLTGALSRIAPLITSAIVPLMGGAITHFLDQDASKAGNSIVGSWINENIPGAANVDDFIFKMSGGYVGTDINDPRYSWNKNKDATQANKPGAVNPNKSRADAILNPSISSKATPGLTASGGELTSDEINQLFKIAPVGTSDADLMALAEKTFPGRKYNTLKARIKQLQQLMQPGPQSGLNTNKGVQVASLDPSIGLSSGSYLANRQAGKDNTSESKLKAQEAIAEEAASKNITQSISVNAKDLFYKADKITFNTDTLEFKVGASSATSGGTAGFGSFGGGGPSGAGFSGPVSGTTAQVMATIRKRESGGNYQAQSKSSSASGAYQFIDSTWQSLTKKFGVGTQYKRAADAPPEVQDKVAQAYVDDILKRNNGDVSKVPLEWYTGNSQGKMSAAAIAANNGLTAEAYQSKWMNDFNQIAGSAASPMQSSVGGSGLQGPDTPLPTAYQNASGTTGSGQDLAGQALSASGSVEVAKKMLGMNENRDYQQLQNFLNQYSGTPPLPINSKSGPWCAKFVNGVLGSQGLPGSGSNMAKSFLNYGGTVFDRATGQGDPKQAQPGDIAIFNRAGGGSGSGHVAFIESVSGETINVIGGNQSDGAGGGVTRRGRKMSEVVGIRRPGSSGQVAQNAQIPSASGGIAGAPGASPMGGSPVSSGSGMGIGSLGGMMSSSPLGAMMGALGGAMGGGNPVASMMGALGGGGSPFGMVGSLMGTLLGALSSSTSMSAATPRSGPVTTNIMNNTKQGSDSTGTNFPDPKSPLPAIDSMFARLFDGSAMFG